MIDPDSGEAQFAEVDAPAPSRAFRLHGTIIFKAAGGALTYALEASRESRGALTAMGNG